jgi:hypothetical protein
MIPFNNPQIAFSALKDIHGRGKFTGGDPLAKGIGNHVDVSIHGIDDLSIHLFGQIHMIRMEHVIHEDF